MITKKEHENVLARLNIANMHLATLCDIVMGVDAADRSDEALILATGSLKRKYLYLRDFLDKVDKISNRPIDASDAMDELDYLLEGIDQDKC